MCGDGRQELKHLDLAAFTQENGTSVLVRIGLKKISEIVPNPGKLISLSEKRGRQANFGNASFP